MQIVEHPIKYLLFLNYQGQPKASLGDIMIGCNYEGSWNRKETLYNYGNQNIAWYCNVLWLL